MAGENRLAAEVSPYLRQHATNPVDWYPWEDAAFAKALAEDKPVFLSIGYSTCHWCHVMAHESFEDAEVAKALADGFVAVKVDREERPDVDAVYMAACQALTGRGGWPLTILMFPDGRPFFAGTYLPKVGAPGRPGLLDILAAARQAWNGRRGELESATGRILDHLRDSAAAQGDIPGPDIFKTALDQLSRSFDAARGGFGPAPKFPSPHILLFLLDQAARTGDPAPRAMAERTLTAMALGGIHDHIGHGYHRYSTDADWLVPHFEKMLSDQSMLLLAHAETAHAAPDDASRSFHRQAALDLAGYMDRALSAPDGGFFTAEDADSEGVEGKFYVWTADEIRAVLPESDAAFFMDLYGFAEDGNFHDESTRRKTGANIPHLTQPVRQWAAARGLDPDAAADRAEAIRQRLFAVRELRVHPSRDEKILADTNGLAIAALARAARRLDQPRLAERAQAAANFVLTHMRDGNGRLLHRFCDGQAAVSGFLDDYAFLAWGLFELHQTTLDPGHLDAALALADILAARFADPKRGGFFLTADDAESLALRPKDLFDAAVPSGNAVALFLLTALGRLAHRPDLEDAARTVIPALAPLAADYPAGFTHFLSALAFATGPDALATVTGDPDAPDTMALLAALRRAGAPGLLVTLVPDAEPAKVSLCRDRTCLPPVGSVEELEGILGEGISGGAAPTPPAGA
ncbi:thioredoxin domain-containing protein [Desulfolutivibrio sulfodismutans]|nr:thioredoxin domain-containing protein [Desulfolutivibrio sulfodismutans]QLA11066.1 DUF255 domain-containing protein [Desulfolutivibrio sulfodismutans DSM 3696]